ncbi:hypothetical protein K7I13_07890 [Brucepastera parasyntrophica]|uniref:hypothetical protein n=1 Tax=Brucepastera parasyntrophica TaxID=2880008 RepID=UPI00210E13EE|nr:hypothetical protein [Brucepastera parasyntrophica]ULQ58496.1 hypothetical protein K7I13_07890 [Brucepastera parasyntrophica]
MTIKDIIEELPAHVVYGVPGFQDFFVGKILAGDLMSDILVSVEDEALLITGLTNEQAVRSADIMGISTILLVNDKLPPPGMKSLAEEFGITLLATPMPMFESCAALGIIREFKDGMR